MNFQNSELMARDLYRHVFCLPLQNVTEARQPAAELSPKTIFKMVAVRNLEF